MKEPKAWIQAIKEESHVIEIFYKNILKLVKIWKKNLEKKSWQKILKETRLKMWVDVSEKKYKDDNCTEWKQKDKWWFDGIA